MNSEYMDLMSWSQWKKTAGRVGWKGGRRAGGAPAAERRLDFSPTGSRRSSDEREACDTVSAKVDLSISTPRRQENREERR